MPRTPPLRILGLLCLVAGLFIASQAAFGPATSPRAIKVKRGDTIWGLAQRFGVEMGQLASTNHMKVSDTLLAGRTLYLPLSAPASRSVRGASKAVGAGDGSGGSTLGRRAAAEVRRAQHSFCTAYRQPTGHAGQLPAALSSDPSRMALRPVFARWARVYGVPLDLMEAEAWQESGWSNDAVSAAGARGIGQVLPDTAAFVNQTLGTNLKLSAPSDNIQMMAAFLHYLLRNNGGQVCGAVAAYYQGLGALQHYGVLPASEVYVRRVLSLRTRFR